MYVIVFVCVPGPFRRNYLCLVFYLFFIDIVVVRARGKAPFETIKCFPLCIRKLLSDRSDFYLVPLPYASQ